MVTKLYYFRTKKEFEKWLKELGCLKKGLKWWRGKGHYYHRGECHISKYTRSLDVKRTSKYRTGKSKIGKGPWRHTHDISRVAKFYKRASRRKYTEEMKRTAQLIADVMKSYANLYGVRLNRRDAYYLVLPLVKVYIEADMDPMAIDWASLDYRNLGDSIRKLMNKAVKKSLRIDVSPKDIDMQTIAWLKEEYERLMEQGLIKEAKKVKAEIKKLEQKLKRAK